MPADPCFGRADETWEKLQATHKRPTTQTISFQALILNYLRFALAGDLAGDWANFGGLAAQFSHLGALLSIATTANATTAMA